MESGLMDIAVVLFTYNRSNHTSQVLDALSKNSLLPEKLYIFQDGLSCNAHKAEWEKVNALIKQVNWCECEVIVARKNKGLAKSIVDGVNDVFRKHDAVIVLEDDCVPAPGFMLFMTQCLEKYRWNMEVYSVSGYTWPMDIEQNGYDAYVCGRMSTWGWGTWKDRWKDYTRDYDSLSRIRSNKRLSEYLAAWGNDLEDMLVNTLTGLNDSWAVFWILAIIEKMRVCINPYRSLIKNIGLDGSGVNCSAEMHEYLVDTDDCDRKSFRLPDETGISDKVIKGIYKFVGSSTLLNCPDRMKRRVLVYGKGKFFLHNEEKLNEAFYIEAIVDKHKRGWYAGKKIIRPCEIPDYAYDNLVIMLESREECYKVRNELINLYHVVPDKIVIGGEYLAG